MTTLLLILAIELLILASKLSIIEIRKGVYTVEPQIPKAEKSINWSLLVRCKTIGQLEYNNYKQLIAS